MSSPSADTLKHAAIGAAVSLALFFLPFSPALGGGVAGYLHGPDRTDGATVGGLSGLLAAVPGSIALTLVAAVFVVVGPGQRSGLLVAIVFFLVALLVTALYGGALGAVGGFAGAFLNEELDGPGSAGGPSGRDTSDAVPAGSATTDSATTGSATTDSVADSTAADRDGGGDEGPEPELVEFDEPVDDDGRN